MAAPMFGGCPVVHTDYRVDRPVFEHYALLDADREAGPFLRAEFTPVPFWMVMIAPWPPGPCPPA